MTAIWSLVLLGNKYEICFSPSNVSFLLRGLRYVTDSPPMRKPFAKGERQIISAHRSDLKSLVPQRSICIDDNQAATRAEEAYPISEPGVTHCSPTHAFVGIPRHILRPRPAPPRSNSPRAPAAVCRHEEPPPLSAHNRRPRQRPRPLLRDFWR